MMKDAKRRKNLFIHFSQNLLYILHFRLALIYDKMQAADCMLLPKNLNFELGIRRKILWTNARNADHLYLRMYKMPNYISFD